MGDVRALRSRRAGQAQRADDVQEPAPVRLPAAQQIRPPQRALLRLPAGRRARRRDTAAHLDRAVTSAMGRRPCMTTSMRILPLLLALTCATPGAAPRA